MSGRDLVGYGKSPPHAAWPGKARVALSFVVNYEEGGENCVLNGDEGSEWLLSDISGEKTRIGLRNPNMETLYEYGSRVGFWRLHKALTERDIQPTVFAVGKALELHPEIAQTMQASGWEVASHGYRWLDYCTQEFLDGTVEQEHLTKTIQVHQTILGAAPLGLYQGKPNANTRQRAADAGFLYDNDAYNDELPFWTLVQDNKNEEEEEEDDTKKRTKYHLTLPYTLECNDMRFNCAPGFTTGDQFFTYLKDTFDQLYAEGQTVPKMMTVGLHCRVIGRPGRIQGLIKFLDYVNNIEHVWICKRRDIAQHWYAHHHPEPALPTVVFPVAKPTTTTTTTTTADRKSNDTHAAGGRVTTKGYTKYVAYFLGAVVYLGMVAWRVRGDPSSSGRNTPNKLKPS